MSDHPHIKVEGFSQATNDIVEHLDRSNDKISIHSNRLSKPRNSRNDNKFKNRSQSPNVGSSKQALSPQNNDHSRPSQAGISHSRNSEGEDDVNEATSGDESLDGDGFLDADLTYREKELMKKRIERLKTVKQGKRLLVSNQITKWCAIKGRSGSQLRQTKQKSSNMDKSQQGQGGGGGSMRKNDDILENLDERIPFFIDAIYENWRDPATKRLPVANFCRQMVVLGLAPDLQMINQIVSIVYANRPKNMQLTNQSVISQGGVAEKESNKNRSKS